MTIYDYQLLPEGSRYQLVDGELHMSPAPRSYHQIISRNLGFILLKYLEQNPIGEVIFAPFDVYLSDVDVYQPDISFFSQEQKNYLSERGGERAPRLVVEILSPGNARLDLGPKREVYARTGVREYWIVDPDNEEVAVYRLQEDAERPERTYDKGATVETALLPGLKVALAEIFSGKPPPKGGAEASR
jgi:Uma2 family endonuclease